MMGALDGKIAIITGAGSGIGRASALRFAAEGAKLVIGDKSAAVHDTAQAVKDAGGTVVALEIDAGVEADVARLVATAQENYGGPSPTPGSSATWAASSTSRPMPGPKRCAST
jgi:NAD(P)-dependent dehydrogenase (short-subunit alcohol dehydrogenase family)